MTTDNPAQTTPKTVKRFMPDGRLFEGLGQPLFVLSHDYDQLGLRLAEQERKLAEASARCIQWAESKGKILGMYENLQAELSALKAQMKGRKKP